jgi:hypothetical protein
MCISSIMNFFKMLSNWVEDKFKHFDEREIQTRALKQENKIEDLKTQYKFMGKEFQEKIDSLNQCNLFLYKEDIHECIKKIDLESYDKKHTEYIGLINNHFYELKKLNDYFGMHNKHENKEKIYYNLSNDFTKFLELLENSAEEHNSEIKKLHNIKDLFDKNEKVIVESFLINLRWRDRFYLMRTIFKKKNKNKNK